MEFVFFLSYLAMFMLGIVATLGVITWIYFHYEKKSKREIEQREAATTPLNPADAEDYPFPASV